MQSAASVMLALALGVSADAPLPGGNVSEVSPRPNVAWVYSVPLPQADLAPPAEPAEALGEDRAASALFSPRRLEIARLRRESDSIQEGYWRAAEDCRFQSTLHFDDRDRAMLIGNDQPCRSRYHHHIRSEKRTLQRRIRELRLTDQESALHPEVLR